MSNKENDLNNILNTIELIKKAEEYEAQYIELTPQTAGSLLWEVIVGTVKGFWVMFVIAFLIPGFVRSMQLVYNLLVLALFLVWGYFIVQPFIRYFKHRKLTSIPENIAKREVAKEKYDEISEFLKNECPIPDIYHELDILRKFQIYLLSCRADSLGECINIYHDDLYKEAMPEEIVSGERAGREDR